MPPSEAHGPAYAGVRTVQISTLRRHPANVRLHDDAQIEGLMRNMRRFGWTVPLLADEQGLLIAGHARLEAATRLRWAEGPVITAAGWGDEDKRLYLLADNALAERSTWDEAGLQREVQALSALGLNVQLTGLPIETISQFLSVPIAPLVEQGAAVMDQPAYQARRHVRILTLQIAKAEWDALQSKLKRLAVIYGTTNSTDTILQAIETCLSLQAPPQHSELDKPQAQ